MVNTSNKQKVNGYSFIIIDGKVVADTKANLKGVNNLTATTKKVAMGILEKTEDAGLGL